MDTTQTLAAIIARCPDLAHQATAALAASQRHSPVAQQRIISVVSDALRQYGDDFDPDERAMLGDLARTVSGGPCRRDLDLRIRVNEAEKARVQDDAIRSGRSVSDYVRTKIGL